MAKATSLGSYDVRPSTSYKCGWKLRHWSMEDGKRKVSVVPIANWNALGFSAGMTLDEARERAKQINAQGGLEREKIRKTALRAARFETVETAFLPDQLVAEFSAFVLSQRHVTDSYKKKQLSHWKYLARMIKDLEIEPEQYAARAEEIYDYFIAKKTSLSYVKKLLNLLNLWSEFVSRKQGRAFETIKRPRGRDRSLIEDTYATSDGYRGESDALTPEMLERASSQLPAGNYEWLLVSVWFGLRPEELRSLNVVNPARWKLVTDRESGVEVLHVYQTKLMSVARDKRWKLIPLVFPEQKKAAKLLGQGLLRAPIYKTMAKAFSGRVTLYGGRKGFMDLMLDRGQGIEDISAWLGHQSIETTWSKYRNRRRVSFKKPA